MTGNRAQLHVKQVLQNRTLQAQTKHIYHMMGCPFRVRRFSNTALAIRQKSMPSAPTTAKHELWLCRRNLIRRTSGVMLHKRSHFWHLSLRWVPSCVHRSGVGPIPWEPLISNHLYANWLPAVKEKFGIGILLQYLSMFCISSGLQVIFSIDYFKVRYFCKLTIWNMKF